MDLVVGATGDLGGRIAEKLLERGGVVRALVRRGSAFGRLEGRDAERCVGDLKDPASLGACLAGVRTVYCTATSTQRGGADTVESVDRKGVGDLIAAADAAGVARFVYVSVPGADPDSPVPLFRAKGENERRLLASNMRAIILRPPLFMEVWIGALIGSQLRSGDKVQIIGDGHKKASFISLEDVAEAAVRAAGLGTESLVLPISAEALSYREVVARIEEVRGTPVEVEALEPGRRLENVPPRMRDVLTELMTGLALGPEMNFTTPEAAQRLGFEFTTVAKYLEQTFDRPASA